MKSCLLLLTVSVAMAAFAQSGSKNAGKGAQIFQEQCSGCHGADGKAETAMGRKVHAADLTSSQVQQMSDSQLTKTVTNGKGKMPAFSGKLSDDDIHDVVTYVRQFGARQ